MNVATTDVSHANMLKILKPFFYANKTYSIRQYIHCNSKHIVYAIECDKCKIQYVGCTINQQKICIRRHLIDTQKSEAVNLSNASRHFCDVHGGNVSNFVFMA